MKRRFTWRGFPESIEAWVVLASVLGFSCSPPAERSAMERVIDVAARSPRRMEVRFAGGLPWSELRPGASIPTAEALELEGMADGVAHEDERAAAVATVLAGRLADGLGKLEELCRRTTCDAAAWSDLAAARYASAVDRNEPERLP